MNNIPVFLMPIKISGDERTLRFFRASVESIKNQTDKNWLLVMVEDFSNDKRVYDVIDEMKDELKEKLHVIYSDKNYGTGAARNKGVLYAKKIGAPFILFNDSDDISDPRRLELVRKAFEDESVNVVYTSFDVIDENDDIVPDEKIALQVREITEGHKIDIVEGENSWIQIAMKKKYTNLTSCTAVKTSLAAEELFPNASVSEDCHTWFRYAAHPGKFVFLREIKGKYRICSGTESRSRSENGDFYQKLFGMDSDGFEQAVKIAKKYGTMGGMDENEIRTAFYVRLALSLLYGGKEEYCKKSLNIATDISKEKTLYYIDKLPCQSDRKAFMREMVTGEIK